jgi:hypothetical protein
MINHRARLGKISSRARALQDRKRERHRSTEKEPRNVQNRGAVATGSNQRHREFKDGPLKHPG